MNWKPILIRKAARARQQLFIACGGIILLAAAIVYKGWKEGYRGPFPDAGNGFLWLAGGMLVSAWLLVFVDCLLRPEESHHSIRQSKIRHGVFLLVWAVIIVGFMWGLHFLFWLIPCGLWLGYAYGFRALHKAFYLVEHPNSPKSILSGLPIESVLNSYNLAFGVGLLFAGVSLLLWVLSLAFPCDWQRATLAAAVLCSVLTVWLLVPTVAFRLGAVQKYQKWLWYVIRLMPSRLDPNAKEQFALFVWAKTHPGDPNPPAELLQDMCENSLPDESTPPLPKLDIGSQADFLNECGGTPNTNPMSPLLRAAIQQDIEALRRLLSHPLQINQPCTGNGDTLLHIAVWQGNKEMVQLLLAQPHIDTAIPNQAGKTPLDLALEKNCNDIAALLKNQ